MCDIDGEKLINLLLIINEKYPKQFERDVWNGILEEDINIGEKSKKIAEWILKML